MKRLATTLAITALALLGAVSVPTAAHAGGTEPEVTCDYAGFNTGRALTNGDHVNMDIVQDGKKFQLNAYVDRNIQGGFDTLGIRINGHPPIPLTEAQVKTGVLKFDYAQYLPSDSKWSVEWTQLNSHYFNQGRDPQKFLHCDGDQPPAVPEKPESITTVKRDESVDCRAKTVSIRDTTQVYDWTLVNNVWIKDEIPSSSYIDSERPATQVECPGVEIPEVGISAPYIIWTAFGASALFGAGIFLRFKRRAY